MLASMLQALQASLVQIWGGEEAEGRHTARPIPQMPCCSWGRTFFARLPLGANMHKGVRQIAEVGKLGTCSVRHAELRPG